MTKRYALRADYIDASHFPMPVQTSLALAPIVQGKPLRGGFAPLDNRTPCKCLPGMAAWGSGGQQPSSQGTAPGGHTIHPTRTLTQSY